MDANYDEVECDTLNQREPEPVQSIILPNKRYEDEPQSERSIVIYMSQAKLFSKVPQLSSWPSR